MAASGEGFLTEEQREVLKTASESTDVLASSPKSPSWLMAEHQIKAPAGNVGIPVRHVRRSHSGKFVRVKKDGGGGKGTWGKLLDTDGETHIDRNDPNYDSGEEPYQLVGSAVSDPLDEYKRKVASIIDEYFTTGEVDLAASELRELGSSEYHPYFIKRLVSMAMDRHDKEKEMASVLLSALYSDVISSTQIKQGFIMLLESADDLAVDILDTVETLALFVARAVVDDILPPAFVTRAKKSLSESSKGFEVLQTAEKSYLSAPHHAELVERRWGGTTQVTVEEVKKRISDLLREYAESGDTSEACRCIFQLGVAFFHHEVVKRALILAMENRAAEPLIVKLLKEASEEGLISSSQMVKGFTRLHESLDDLALDIPSAKSLFESLVQLAITDNWLDSSFMNSNGDGPATEAEYDEKLRRYKEEIVSIIHEYFLSDDIPELIRSLVDLGSPEYNSVFLKKLITLAMDRKNREKEMASVLLSTLHIEIFSTQDIVDGFTLLLESADDTALDILDASNELALFLARAVIDDVLAPLNLEEIGNRLAPNCNGSETVHVAQSLIAARHAGERLLRCWGGGTGWAVEDAKDKIVKLLEEYETGGVVGEACQCIRDLGMPFFNHEVVKKALVMAMEKKNERMLDLLQECYSEGLITTNQMTKGFGRVKDGQKKTPLYGRYSAGSVDSDGGKKWGSGPNQESVQITSDDNLYQGLDIGSNNGGHGPNAKDAMTSWSIRSENLEGNNNMEANSNSPQFNGLVSSDTQLDDSTADLELSLSKLAALKINSSPDTKPSIPQILHQISNGTDESSTTTKHTALQQLIDASAVNDSSIWAKYFNQILMVVLEVLDDPDSSIRELALSLIVEMLKNQKDAMEDSIEIVIEKLLNLTKDTIPKVSNEAEHCLTVVLSQHDPFRCLSVIVPLLVTEDEKTLVTCINCLTKLVGRLSQEELMGQLQSFLPALFDAFGNQSADVRKTVVFCLVDIYIMLGKAFLPYLEGLNSTQLRLVTIYANRISQARTGTPIQD